jgi:predicted transcriptional regulator
VSGAACGAERLAAIQCRSKKEVLMSSVKDEMTRIIQEQPDDSSFDEILRELALAGMIRRGLQDSETGRTVDDVEMKRQVDQWRK